VKIRFVILLICVLIPGATCVLAQDLPSQARTAVSEKRYNEALTIYRNLLAEKPGDVDYIVWIARLSSWTGDNDTAAEYYSKALVAEPGNIDALLGKANLLMWKQRYAEAAELLEKARELAPSNTEVELAWSRYYHYQGNEADAKRQLTKVLVQDRENKEALRLQESLVPDHTIELRVGYEGDTLPGTAPGAIEEASISYLTGRNRIGIDFAHFDRFGEAGNLGGMHFSRKLNGATSVRASALFGGGGAIVARRDWSLGFSRKVYPGLVLGGDYRHIDFPSLKIDAAIANADYYFEKPVWIQTSYAANRIGRDTTPSFLARINFKVRKNVTLNAGYGRGTEVFQLALPSEFGSFTQDSYIGGVNLDLSRKTRIETAYTLGRRSTGLLQNTFVIAMVHTL